MRSLFFGDPPDIIRRASDANRRALETALEIMKPGVTCGEVDAAMREKIEGEGLDAQSRMGYASGYGWDEGSAASLAPNDPLVLEPGHTFHVIPHSYVEGWGFVGMSEQVTVTENGCRVLANQDESCPRDLLVVNK
jgi:Xaa-Pro dipeptidase